MVAQDCELRESHNQIKCDMKMSVDFSANFPRKARENVWMDCE